MSPGKMLAATMSLIALPYSTTTRSICSPVAVVLLDQQVLALNHLARGFLLRREEVLDDLEHEGERRQIEHQHHHALDAGRAAELVAGVAQVVEEVAVEQVLALLLQPDRA